MSSEFYIVFDEPVWYKRNRAIVQGYIESLETFRKNIGDKEYWLRSDDSGGDWDYGVRLIFREHDIILEVSSHPPAIVNDIKRLSKLISSQTKIMVVDDDGERMEGYE